MEKGIGVYLTEGIPYTYKDYHTGERKSANTQPGWHIYDGVHVKGGEPSPFEFKYGTLLLTKDGTIVKVSRPGYTGSESRPERPDFSILQAARHEDEGYMVYYDDKLKHKEGNHKRPDSNLDIIGIYTSPLLARCPHCSHTLDEDDINTIADK